MSTATCKYSRRLRFRIRTLLASIAILGICLAIWSNPARRERVAVAEIRASEPPHARRMTHPAESSLIAQALAELTVCRVSARLLDGEKTHGRCPAWVSPHSISTRTNDNEEQVPPDRQKTSSHDCCLPARGGAGPPRYGRSSPSSWVSTTDGLSTRSSVSSLNVAPAPFTDPRFSTSATILRFRTRSHVVVESRTLSNSR